MSEDFSSEVYGGGHANDNGDNPPAVGGVFDLVPVNALAAPAMDPMDPGGEHHWLQLASGARFNLSGPPSRISIEDIGWQLAHMCRFAGATKSFYSVAQHSVIVSAVAMSKGAGVAGGILGLLHDAEEIAISDIPRPTKWMLPLPIRNMLKTASERITQRILWGLDQAEIYHHMRELEPVIKYADNVALATERRDLMVPTGDEWAMLETPLETVIHPMQPAEARELFLERWYGLTTGVIRDPSQQH